MSQTNVWGKVEIWLRYIMRCKELLYRAFPAHTPDFTHGLDCIILLITIGVGQMAPDLTIQIGPLENQLIYVVINV
uniref:Uncharacterized protein n=1 Tax=Acrobeloides nanus TaxID=290746 RepID=A0A914ERW6_9BILA